MSLALLEDFLSRNQVCGIIREGEVFIAESFSFQMQEINEDNYLAEDPKNFDVRFKKAVARLAKMMVQQADKEPSKRVNYKPRRKRPTANGSQLQ